MIDWERILTNAGIEYQPGAGANIEIACCWCGSADQGKHLSISLEGNGYRCWRRPDDHFGKSPVRLLTQLLKISITEANSLVGYSAFHASDSSSDFTSNISVLLGMGDETNKVTPIRHLAFPSNFRTIHPWGGTKTIFKYIEYRGYTEAEAERLVKIYDLKTALDGPFAFRVVIPIYMQMGLVNWTGRSIASSSTIRYRTLTTDPQRSKTWGMPVASLQINKTLWNYHTIATSRAKNLVVCEGPFDAIRVDFFGNDDTRSTCLFGKNISDYQIGLLEKVRDNYDNLLLVLDNDAEMEMLKKLGRISHLEPRFLRLPKGVSDPAEIPREEILKWL